MNEHHDLGAMAKDIIDSNPYMTLGTADGSGRAWASPVYYAQEGYTVFYWVSSPEANHSRDLAARPEVAVVIFDSQAPVGRGQGVYMSALAETLSGDDLDRGIAIFSRRSEAHGVGGPRRTCARPLAIVCTGRLRRSTPCSVRKTGGRRLPCKAAGH